VFSSDDEYGEPDADSLEVGSDVDETVSSLTMIVDTQGCPVVKGFSECEVEEDALIPEDIPKRFDSDERQYSGSSGDVGAQLSLL
jgi:hypothetical protein